MKTPMQELVDWVNDYPIQVTTIHKSAVIAKATELLEKEKEVLDALKGLMHALTSYEVPELMKAWDKARKLIAKLTDQ